MQMLGDKPCMREEHLKRLRFLKMSNVSFSGKTIKGEKS